MDIVAFTLKNSTNYPQWGCWWNLYHFALPDWTGREVWQNWCDRLIEWEAGFHLQSTDFLGVGIIPLYGASGSGADGVPNVFSRVNAPGIGLRQQVGVPKYVHGLRVPYGAKCRNPGAQVYHGAIVPEEIEPGHKGGVRLKTYLEFEDILTERAQSMGNTHFNYLRTMVGGGGSPFAGFPVKVDVFRVCHPSLMHATTRARFRNRDTLLQSYPTVWAPLLAAAGALGPIHHEATNVGVDVIPVPIVARGIDAAGGLYALSQRLKDMTGSQQEGDPDQAQNEPRFGMTRDSIVDLGAKLGQWYEQAFQPLLSSVQTYEYAGDDWYKDDDALKIYDALGKGLAIAAPLCYADWVGMKDHKGGLSSDDPLPDVIELSM